jgi:hypothetical protein
MTIFQYISLLWIRFTPLEKRLLSEVRSVLPEEAKPIFDAQVSAITKCQRISKWNEISYYRMRGGKVSWEGVPLFPCTDEIEIAQVRFKSGGKRYKATLISIAGHIFEFRLQHGGRAVAFTPWESPPQTTLLDDPMRQPTGKRKPAVLLPAWADFLNKQGSSPCEGWTLYDETSTYSVSLDTGEFLILAEREGNKFVLQRIEPPSEHPYYLDSHDGTPELLSKSFEAVIRK